MSERIAFVVSGNHMSGLSKSHELVALGAQRVGETVAAPCYRFYALATDPVKPALVRMPDACASVIVVEEWSLATDALAHLAVGIQPPQGIGRVLLRDGRLVHGFVVEHGALAGASDITHLGSWRRHLGITAAASSIPSTHDRSPAMPTTREIELVQQSFAKVAPQAEAVAALFYQRLFELDSSLRPLFKSDLKDQGRKLMAMLTAVVNGLGQLEALVPTAQALARRHVVYGVQPAHYATVGAALLWTLGQGLGPAFDAELKAAWTDVYGVLAKVMIDAAAAPQFAGNA